MNSSKLLRAKNALAWNYAGAALKLFAQFFIQVSLVRLLGPEDFGDSAILIATLGVAWLIADFGFSSAIIQKKNISEEELSFVLLCTLISSLILSFIIYSLSSFLANLINAPRISTILKFCAAIIPIQTLSSIPLSILKKNFDAKRQQYIQILSYVAGMGGVAITLAYFGSGAWSIAFGFAAQSLISLILGLCFVNITITSPPKWSPELFKFGSKAVVTNLVNWFGENIDRFVFAKFLGMYQVGGYAAMANLTRAPLAFFLGSLQAIIFATTSDSQNESNNIAKSFLRGLGPLFSFSVMVFGLLALNSDLIISILYGSKWIEMHFYFAAFCLSAPGFVIVSICGPVLWGVNRVELEMKSQILFLIASVGSLGVGIMYFGAQTVWFVPILSCLRAGLLIYSVAKVFEFDLTNLLRVLSGGAIAAFSLFILFVAATELGLSPLERNMLCFPVLLAEVLVLEFFYPNIILDKRLKEKLCSVVAIVRH